ncbi:hypothetical protein B0T22DRAFT_233585 [Podospora appendiculata]|uniref:Uncharacterized protein n=1 Tax=Podospora appendiculata TaxID=314037 RepID=A0AAE1CAS7_9PEZI|nr:hypothetical protein B0T22DRAFT_233585 [Podospora appendiculata]
MPKKKKTATKRAIWSQSRSTTTGTTSPTANHFVTWATFNWADCNVMVEERCLFLFLIHRYDISLRGVFGWIDFFSGSFFGFVLSSSNYLCSAVTWFFAAFVIGRLHKYGPKALAFDQAFDHLSLRGLQVVVAMNRR